MSMIRINGKAWEKDRREVARKMKHAKKRFSTSKKGEVLEGKGGATEAGWHKAATEFHCPKRYQLAFVRGVVVPIVQTPEYFTVGTAVHAGRARWFARGFSTSEKTWKSIVEAVRQAIEEDKLPSSYKAEHKALTVLQQYVEHWSMKPRPIVKAVEYKLGPTPIRKGDPFYLARTAKLDDVSEYPESGHRLMIGECKTTSGSIAQCVAEYTLHGQTMMQRALWSVAEQGEQAMGKVAGIMMDIIKKPSGPKDECKFDRVPIYISPFQMAWYEQSINAGIRAMAATDWDTEVPRMGFWNGCRIAGARGAYDCEFKDLCRLGPDGTSGYVLSDGTPLKQFKPGPGRTKMPWE